jgi:hypothetical protein
VCGRTVPKTGSKRAVSAAGGPSPRAASMHECHPLTPFAAHGTHSACSPPPASCARSGGRGRRTLGALHPPHTLAQEGGRKKTLVLSLAVVDEDGACARPDQPRRGSSRTPSRRCAAWCVLAGMTGPSAVAGCASSTEWSLRIKPVYIKNALTSKYIQSSPYFDPTHTRAAGGAHLAGLGRCAEDLLPSEARDAPWRRRASLGPTAFFQ